MRFDILTLFPELFIPFMKEGVLGRAVNKGIIDIRLLNIRSFARGRHKVTDDRPYGGGNGMVMKPGPIYRALESIEKIVNTMKDFVSLDVLVEENGESSIADPLGYRFPSALDKAISSDLSRIIDGILSDLTAKNREMIKLRFGIGKDYNRTLEEIGEEFNLSRERVRQIIDEGMSVVTTPQACLKLKDFLNSN